MAATFTSALDVVSSACILLGGGPIQDWSTTKGGKAKLVYAPTIDGLLSKHNWHFAEDKKQLARAEDAPINEWSYAYALPVERLGGPNAVFNTDAVGAVPILDWQTVGQYIYCNETSLYVDYSYRPEVVLWPGYFCQLVLYAMASVLAVPIMEDQSKMTTYHQIAYGPPSDNGEGGLLAGARRADSKQAVSRAVNPGNFDLINCRG